MPSTILLKSKQTTGAPSVGSDVLVGELALNTKDGEIYIGMKNGGSPGDDSTVMGSALMKNGGTLTGDIDMGDNDITDVKSIAFNDGDAIITEVKDEDNMATNSATMIATQQSIKAYVDSNAVYTLCMVHNYYTTSSSGLYIPFGGSQRAGTDAGSESYNDDSIFVAPFDGKLVTLWLRNDYSGTATPGAIACYLNTNDSDGSVMNGGINTWAYQTVFEYSCTVNNTFSQGDLVAIKVDPAVAPRYVTITSVWEFTK